MFTMFAGLFNLRGKDVPYNPVFVSYAMITLNGITLYMYDKAGRLTPEVKEHLEIGSAPCTDEGKGWELDSAATLASQPAAGHYCNYDLGLRPVCGAGRRKLRPNLAPVPKLHSQTLVQWWRHSIMSLRPVNARRHSRNEASLDEL